MSFLRQNQDSSTTFNPQFSRNNMEVIKKTMQMHEDIFKNQVRELHRLYRVQKILTSELKMKQNHDKIYKSTPLTITTTMTPTIGYIPIESSRDRTRSSTKNKHEVTPNGFDLETTRIDHDDIHYRNHQDQDMFSSFDRNHQAGQSSSGPSVSETGNSYEDGELIELTLSIGRSSGKRRMVPQSDNQNDRKDVVTELDSFKSSGSMSISSTTFNQERKRPHLLFQGLSINRT